jgi:hypothetical protein
MSSRDSVMLVVCRELSMCNNRGDSNEIPRREKRMHRWNVPMIELRLNVDSAKRRCFAKATIQSSIDERDEDSSWRRARISSPRDYLRRSGKRNRQSVHWMPAEKRQEQVRSLMGFFHEQRSTVKNCTWHIKTMATINATISTDEQSRADVCWSMEGNGKHHLATELFSLATEIDQSWEVYQIHVTARILFVSFLGREKVMELDDEFVGKTIILANKVRENCLCHASDDKAFSDVRVGQAQSWRTFSCSTWSNARET